MDVGGKRGADAPNTSGRLADLNRRSNRLGAVALTMLVPAARWLRPPSPVTCERKVPSVRVLWYPANSNCKHICYNFHLQLQLQPHDPLLPALDTLIVSAFCTGPLALASKDLIELHQTSLDRLLLLDPTSPSPNTHNTHRNNVRSTV